MSLTEINQEAKLIKAVFGLDVVFDAGKPAVE